MFFGGFSEFSPLGTSVIFITEPAEVYAFFLDGAGVEWAYCTHSVFAFASFALAFGFPVVGGAEPARKAANSDFNVTFFHLWLHFVVTKFGTYFCLVRLNFSFLALKGSCLILLILAEPHLSVLFQGYRMEREQRIVDGWF